MRETKALTRLGDGKSLPGPSSKIPSADSIHIHPVADPEGVQGVRLNPTLCPTFLNIF